MFSSLIVSASPSSEKPGPGNTGCQIPVEDLVAWADHDKNYNNNNKITLADTDIVGALFTGRMQVMAPRVTFTDCIFSGTLDSDVSCFGPLYNLQTYDDSVSAMKVSHCTLTESTGANLNIDKGVTTVQTGNSLGANNLIEYCDIGGNCQDAAKSNKGTTFYKCWLHDAGNAAVKPDGHADLLQSVKPDGDLIIDQCNFDMIATSFGTTGYDECNCYRVPNKKANAAVIWKCERDDGIDCSGDLVIKDSWMNGGNYMFYHAMAENCCDGGCGSGTTGTGSSIDCGDYYSDLTVSGNKIGRDFKYGLISTKGDIIGTRTFVDNMFEDGMPIADGGLAGKDYNRYNCTHAAAGAYNECPGVDWCCDANCDVDPDNCY